MKRFFFTGFALLFSLSLGAQYRSADISVLYDSETVTALKGHVSYIASSGMEGRKAGSEGEKLTAEYIGETLRSYGIELITPVSGSEFGLKGAAGDTLVSRNVAAFIQGVDPALNDRYIVVGARMDNLGSDTYMVDGVPVNRIYYGANGNASGLSMLLELGKMLHTGRLTLRRSVILIAFGASEETFSGSWYFLNRAFSDVDRIDAMVNLDMLGTASRGFYAYTSSNADMNMTISSMKGDILPISPVLTAIEPYPSDHQAFYDRQIPSVLFTTGRYPEHGTEKDTPSILDYEGMERELEYIYNYVLSLSGAAKPVFDPSRFPRKETVSETTISFTDVDQRPTFLGSSDPRVFLEKWVYQYLKYPKEAVEAGNQGRVLVDFVIDEKGEVRDARVIRGVSPALDEEALRIINASPKWKPGRHRGKKVRTSLTLAIEFRLEKKSDKGFGINGKIVK